MQTLSTYATAQGVRFPIQGRFDTKFSRVVEAFITNFKRGSENGAACAVSIEGELVVDLWGGFTDKTFRGLWAEDTVVCVMSVTKAMTAACVHLLADRGLVDLDAPMARYWPEFAQAGKEAISVRWVLDHRAGLPILDHVPDRGLYEWETMTRLLAQQKPAWDPGSQAGYHVITHGFLLGELVRQVTGIAVRDFFTREFAEPLGLDFQIGLRPEDDRRCATFIPAIEGTLLEVNQKEPYSIKARAWAGTPLEEDFNSPSWRAAQVPGANGHGNARAVNRFYAMLACGGTLDGKPIMSSKAVSKMGELSHNMPELVLGRQYNQAYGVIRSSHPYIYMGPNPNAFGHHGVGGAIGYCDPDRRISFGYTMNQMHARLDNGPRGGGLTDALYSSIDPSHAPVWR
jgi:CubicO group peptidase (beta-lactamase class C family)